MAEAKVAKVEKPVPSDREVLITSWVTQGSDLAERTAQTSFSVVRDVSSELSQRILSTLNFLESTQGSLFKLLRTIEERADKLAADTIDTVENVTLGLIRSARDTGKGVSELATTMGKPRESRVA